MKKTRILGILVLLIAAPAQLTAGDEVDREIEGGLLSWVHLKSGPPGADAVIVVRPFDASEADLGTGAEGGKPKHVAAAKKMQEDAPGVLAEQMVEKLKALAYFAEVHLDSGDAPAGSPLVLQGRFTILNPGSKAKRYFAGFGAGREVLEIKGVLKDASGTVLVEFRQKRLSVMGVFGGDYQKKMAAGMKRFGNDVATFLHAWSTGQPLEGE